MWGSAEGGGRAIEATQEREGACGIYRWTAGAMSSDDGKTWKQSRRGSPSRKSSAVDRAMGPTSDSGRGVEVWDGPSAADGGAREQLTYVYVFVVVGWTGRRRLCWWVQEVCC